MANLHLALISQNNIGLLDTFTFTEKGGCIGRSVECDWTLDDGERFISNKHVLVSFVQGKFVLTDTSSNGTFLNKSATPIGKGNIVDVQVNDTIKLGTFELAVCSIDLGPTTAAAQVNKNDLMNLLGTPTAAPSSLSNPITQPNIVDEVTPLSNHGVNANKADANNLGLFDILSQNMSEQSIPSTLPPIGASSVKPDVQHSSPNSAAQKPAHNSGQNPGHNSEQNAIPDDWDLDDLAPPAPKCAPVIPKPLANPAPAASLAPSPASSIETPVEQPISAARNKPDIQPQSSSAVPDIAQQPVDDPFFDGLYTKLGLPEADKHNVDKRQFIDDIATVLMTSTQGMMGLLAGRSVFKQESRLSMTMIQPRSNNPIKFSLDPSDALEMLLVKKKPGYLTIDAAYAEVMRDLQLHQTAFLSGLQASLEGVLKELSPEMLEKEMKDKGRGFLGKTNSGQKWQAYTDKQSELVTRVKENLNDVLSAHFSNAYEAHIKNTQEN